MPPMRSQSQETEAIAPIRTVLVGLGRIGYAFHGPAINDCPDYQLVGVVDPLEERRNEAAEKWGARAFESLETALVELKPELVVVASPTKYHTDQCTAAFAHGAHVLCDKPVAPTVGEVDQILDAATQANRRFVAFQPRRMAGDIRKLKEILASGIIGEVRVIRHTRTSYVRRNDWQALKAHGGGMLNNYGSHVLDEIILITNAEPVRSLHCWTRRIATLGDAEDYVRIVLVTESGRFVDLEISQGSAIPSAPWHIIGDHGAIVWDAAETAWRVKYFDPSEAPPIALQEGMAAQGRQYVSEELPWKEQLFPCTPKAVESYYACAARYFRDGAPPPVDPRETRLLVSLINRCHAQAVEL